ncbi:MAG: F0F1 ATP synthase subunit delta [Microbacterium sp.]
MGSATTQALAATRKALDAASGIDLDVARELFAAARVVGDSPQLSGALADPTAPVQARTRVVTDVFGNAVGRPALALVASVVEQRWSKADDLVGGIEDLAIRAAAVAEPEADVEGELFAIAQTVAAHPQLELALGGRLGAASAKGDLVATVLDGRASAATTLIVSSLVQRPRERRVRQLLTGAMRTVSDQRGRTVATVTSATPLSAEQAKRLSAALAARYGRDVALNAVIDPALVGGLRVQIADDVIDGSISGRLADLRQRLAG